jgi:hypothetical protein
MAKARARKDTGKGLGPGTRRTGRRNVGTGFPSPVHAVVVWLIHPFFNILPTPPLNLTSQMLLWEHVIFVICWDGVELGPLVVRPLIGLLYHPWVVVMMMMTKQSAERMTGTTKRSIRRNPAPVSLCPPQIPTDLTRDRTRPTAMGSRQLTA